jgi:hypothetical protein
VRQIPWRLSRRVVLTWCCCRGARLKETGSINQSLMTLGRCMAKIRWNQQHPFAVAKVGCLRSKCDRVC